LINLLHGPVWSMMFFGLGIWAGISSPSVQATTGACSTGFCDITADGPTYFTTGCNIGVYTARYGGSANVITSTNYASCGVLTTAGSQASLFQTAVQNRIDTGSTNNILDCNHVDCGAVKPGYHRGTGCICQQGKSFYCIYTLNYFSTVYQNGCILANLVIQQTVSPTTKAPPTT
jgi:hypothetical protein